VSKIDFTRLSEPISNALDTDYIDVYRQIDESPERDLYATNVKCHIAIKTMDNSDPDNVDVQPVITSLRIHCGTWVDLKNNDYIIAKRCDLNGNVLHYYSGIIGEPAVSMARQSVNMIMSSLKQDDKPIPPPPPIEESVIVIINYLDEIDEPLHNSVTENYKRGTHVIIEPLNFDNYELIRTELNGENVEIVDIEDINENSVVNFFYEAVTGINSIRVLVNGDYVKDNGQFAYGLHLYAPISVLSADTNTIKLANNKFYHEEMGTITIGVDTKFRDNLNNWHIVTTEPVKVDDGYIITFTDTEAVDCYITNWYGV